MRYIAIRLAIFGVGLIVTPSLAQTALPVANLNGGDPVSAQADAIATQDIEALLRQAQQAARAGRLPLANELVERAEALALTRSTIAGTETIPVQDGAVAKMAGARAALGRRDVGTATLLMAEAASLSHASGM